MSRNTQPCHAQYNRSMLLDCRRRPLGTGLEHWVVHDGMLAMWQAWSLPLPSLWNRIFPLTGVLRQMARPLQLRTVRPFAKDGIRSACTVICHNPWRCIKSCKQPSGLPFDQQTLLCSSMFIPECASEGLILAPMVAYFCFTYGTDSSTDRRPWQTNNLTY